MKLKIKLLKWSAGLPVAMLNKKTADELSVRSKDRVLIKTFSKNPKKISTIVDTIQKVVGKNEIAVSSELKKRLGLKIGQKVEVTLAQVSKSLMFIHKKLDGKKLTEAEINEIIEDIVNNSLSESEVTLFVASMYEKGMNIKETSYLIKAILKSGNVLKLKNKYIVDKHCIGGIAGNRTTPIVVSICSAAGLTMPKSSSRAITSAAGTADVIETVTNIDFSIDQLKKIIKKTKACLVWGGSLGMVPADSKIIQIEKALKLDPEAQLLASIMSKKIAMDSKYILIDIPYGKSAKVNKVSALNLKKKFEKLGKHFNRKIKVVLTDGSKPIGNGVGPALELRDVVNVLDPYQDGPKDLEEKSLFLASEIFKMVGKKNTKKLAKEILSSGKAFKKFNEIIEAQGGKLKKLKLAKFSKDIVVKKSGKILEMNNKKINFLARIAGCPADKFSGIYLEKHVGDKLKKGDKVLTIYSESKIRLRDAIKFYIKEKPIKIH